MWQLFHKMDLSAMQRYLFCEKFRETWLHDSAKRSKTVKVPKAALNKNVV
jgi:hypothetical protein